METWKGMKEAGFVVLYTEKGDPACCCTRTTPKGTQHSRQLEAKVSENLYGAKEGSIMADYTDENIIIID